ncbi:YoaK family protein [Frigidibacter sp. MR17.14]|uniref:YoaK family protein n=1 Tax=Frigidibacter sp. MR17.14 TaxID=3126509 RepID=UPI003012AE24
MPSTSSSPTLRTMRLAAAHHRSPASDRLLGLTLAAIAGSLNAGGFLLLSQFTSHMTGHLSQVAGGIVGQNLFLILASLGALVSFTAGAALSAATVAWGEHRRLSLRYALPLGLQGLLLAALPLVEMLPPAQEGKAGLLIVSFVMGLQNATITRISGARIRTSHATGLITDMGIEIGRSLYRLGAPGSGVHPDAGKLGLYTGLVLAFIAGGIAGAIGHGAYGWAFAIPPAVVLLVLAVLPRPPRPARG